MTPEFFGGFFMENEKLFVLIMGPTGVGKTDIALALAQRLPHCIEIINADVGQFYEPLTIGTAKPLLEHPVVPHHLFNVIERPEHFTVMEFRKVALERLQEIWSKKKIPVVVGGSGFYSKALFFPPCQLESKKQVELEAKSTAQLWQELKEVDSVRAQEIHPHDRYRIQRALEIWYTFGIKPSLCKPLFDPPGNALVYFITRERDELYRRINERTKMMLLSGWIEEVEHLSSGWWDFLLHKKLLGYPEIISYCRKELSRAQVEESIAQKTRAYAKRQITFWRSLEQELKKYDPCGTFVKDIREINLTFLSADLYIEELEERLTDFCQI